MEALFLLLGFVLPLAAYLQAARVEPTPRRLIGAPALAGLGVGLCYATLTALMLGPVLGFLLPWIAAFTVQGALVGVVGVAGRLLGKHLDRRI